MAEHCEDCQSRILCPGVYAATRLDALRELRREGYAVVDQERYEKVAGASVLLHGGVLAVAHERRRQIDAEGWTPEHDDEHDMAEMPCAAEHYLNYAISQINGEGQYPQAAPSWPWDASWWKPSDDPIRNLVKAGALIAAEIDRLQRAAAAASDEGSDA